ncbi:MAG TPA: hypothetical protein VFN26_11580 [Candidatus Acidoferrum sp.]|nr:hypothetical protein [Candidatus Acidoferrum sp.]
MQNYRNSAAAHCREYEPRRHYVPKPAEDNLPMVREVGTMPAKLCVVLSYNVAKGSAFVNFKGFRGNALLTQAEIIRAGWTEVYFGNLLVCDIEQHEGKARATNARAATDADFEE